MTKYTIASGDQEYIFKDEVPVFYFTNIEETELKVQPKSNLIDYSFNKDICKKHNLDGLFDEQIDSLLESTRVDFDSFNKQEKRQLVKMVLDKNLINLQPYSSIKPLTKYIQNIAQDFIKEVGCFIDVKFNEISNLATLTDKYTISICMTTKNVIAKNFGWQAMTTFIYNNFDPYTYILNASTILYDGFITPKSEAEFFTEPENMIKHEILHSLFINHPTYSSLDQNIQYRSILENGLTNLMENCASLYNSLDKVVKCGQAPKDLTPVDVKGLISIWGASRDDSQICQELRSKFVYRFEDDLELVSGPSNETLMSEF